MRFVSVSLFAVALAFVAQLTAGATSCKTIADCTDDFAYAKQYEGSYTDCFAIECDRGVCSKVNLKTARPDDTLCTRQQCTLDDSKYSFIWEEVPSELANNCVTDECTKRECIDEDNKGCVETDTCVSLSNDCFTMTCDKSNKCHNTSNLVTKQCTKEICVDGKKVVTDTCPERKCYVGKCNENDECEYTPAVYPGEPDPCKNYTCDEKTGEWSEKDKCDTDPCSNYRCSVTGECSYTPYDCSSEVNMTGLECAYRPVCMVTIEGQRRCGKEATGEKQHVCGQCIPSEDPDYKELLEETNKCYQVVCTVDPPEVHRINWTDNGCFAYDCDNETGMNYTVLCNSEEGKVRVCTEYKCLSLSEAMSGDYVVQVVLEGIDFDTFSANIDTVRDAIGLVTKQDTSNWRIGVEFVNGTLAVVDFFIADGNTANIVADNLKDEIINHKDTCNYGLICSIIKSAEAKSPSDVNGVPSVHKVSAFFVIALVALVSMLY